MRDFDARGKCAGSMVNWPTKLAYIKVCPNVRSLKFSILQIDFKTGKNKYILSYIQARQLTDKVIVGNDIVQFIGRKGTNNAV